MKTKADMQLRHQELHQAFDELLACYLHSRRTASITDLIQSLMEYSQRQTQAPTCLEHESAPEWTPTMGNVAALPEPIRRYVRELETKSVERRQALENLIAGAYESDFCDRKCLERGIGCVWCEARAAVVDPEGK